MRKMPKNAARIILQDKYTTYSESRKKLNIMKLSTRRKMLCFNFGKRCLEQDKMKKLFPIKKNIHNMKKRKSEQFEVFRSKKRKMQTSTIPYIQHLLNANEDKL